MFLMYCGDTVPHPAHTHIKHWQKARLKPHLRGEERYPDEWDATYRCPGIKTEALQEAHK